MLVRHSRGIRFANTVSALTLVLFCAIAATAQPPTARNSAAKPEQSSAEQKTARYFESLRKFPPQQLAFLLKMPKGGGPAQSSFRLDLCGVVHSVGG